MKWLTEFNKIFSGAVVMGILAIALFSLTGYLGTFNRYFELTSHFRLQYFILSIAVFIYFLTTGHNLWWIVSVFCIVINIFEVVPWYLPQPGLAGNNALQLRILELNVLTDNDRYSQVISLVREENPDVAVFVEVSKTWANELKVLKDILPYSSVHQDSDSFGTAIYSKLPLENSSTQIFGGGRANLLADINMGGKIISLIAVHPSFPLTEDSFVQRNWQLENLGNYVTQEVKNPVAIVGDFNTTMWSPYYKRFIRKTKLNNARSGFGILPTWHSGIPLLSIPIDHCLISQEIKVLKIKTGRNVGSDHLPLIADIALKI